MTEIPYYGLREAIGPSVDKAIYTCARDDRVTWDLSWTVVNTPAGRQLVGQLVLTMPSAILGQGRLIIASAFNDLNRLEQEPEALELVRHMVDTLRDMKAQQLAMRNPPNGQHS